MSSVRHIPIKIEISADRTPVDASSLPDVDVARATRCLATFTTGSTGMPKILYRDHSYLQLQTCAISQSYAKLKGLPFREDAKYSEEKDEVGFTNLTMVPLHFMKVESRGDRKIYRLIMILFSDWSNLLRAEQHKIV